MLARVVASGAARAPRVARASVLGTSAPARFVSDRFTKATTAVTKVAAASNADKLELYALYKQATHGPNDTSKPGAFDFVGKAKWNAWTELGSMSKDAAEAAYIEKALALGAQLDGTGPASGAGGASAAAPAPAGKPSNAGDHVLASTADGVLTLTLNRPDKRNAITRGMYQDLIDRLDNAESDPSIRVVVLTGAGGFYSSGNDLSNFTENMPPEGPAKLAAEGGQLLQRFVDRFISFPKLIIGAVNGPAVGIPVTTLPLLDVVYASSKATFHAPFPALGQTPEACSSLTFPLVMGPARATEFLLLGRKLTAAEAASWGLVSSVFEDSEFKSRVDAAARAAAALPPNALRLGKGIIRSSMGVEKLKQVNAEECRLLEQRWLSDECFGAITAFMSKAGKGSGKGPAK